MRILALVCALVLVAPTAWSANAPAKKPVAKAPARKPAKTAAPMPAKKEVAPPPPVEVKKEAKINENPLTAQLVLTQPTVAIGAGLPITISLELDPNYHGYKEKFDLKILSPEGATFTPFELTPIVKFYDKLQKKDKEGIHNRAEMKTVLTIPASVPVGPGTISFEVKYQACAEDHCLFPKKLQVQAPIQFLAGTGPAMANTQAPPPPSAAEVAPAPTAPQMAAPKSSGSFDLAREMQDNPFKAFALVFFAGVLTSLTPCIFPMIPITLSIIGARAVGKNDPNAPKKKFSSKGLVLSMFYVLGIALTYALLGTFAAMSGMMFGAALGNPLVVSAIAVLFVAMGLSMYGLFEIQAPAFIRDRLGNANTGSGYGGAFVSGLVAGVVAGPCVGPVLVSVLAFVAKTQSAVLGFSLLFTYSWGLGMLFLALGAFSGLLGAMPRSGGWMDAVKFVFGTSMIGLALYVIHPILDPRMFYALFGMTTVLIASFYGAWESNEGLTPMGRMRKGVMVMLLAVGIVFTIRAAVGEQAMNMGGGAAVASAAAPGAAQPAANNLPWKKYNEAEFQAALRSGKPVVLDFWAEWCQACKELEHYTYSDPRVKAESANFQLFAYDATAENDELAALMKKYAVVGLPTLLFFGADGQLREDLTLTGFEHAEPFLNRMNTAKGARGLAAEHAAN